MAYTPIKEIDDTSELWTILVRVQRRWNMYDKASPNELFCISLLLVDEEGTKIQASIIGANLLQKFSKTCLEKRTYKIDSFKVTTNNLNFKASTHPFKIGFNTKTFVVEEAAELPLEVFSFMPIPDILAIPEKAKTDQLIDVVGFVKTMGKLEEFPSQTTNKCYLRMMLADAEGNEIECVLFDQCASETCLAQMQNPETDSPLVAVINLARITWSQHNGRQIASSFEATRVYFNHDIPEVHSLIASVADRATPIVTQYTQSMPSQRSRVSGGDALLAEPKVTFDKKNDQAVGVEFVVACQLMKFETSFDWCYDGCAKCSSKPKPIDNTDPKSTLFCKMCNKVPDKIEPKMKLTFTAKDDTDTAQVTFWDDLATQLLGKNIQQLRLELPEGRTIYDAFPQDLKKIEGKKVVLKLRRNSYNIGKPKSSISVCDFTVCEDLLQEFNSASSQDNDPKPTSVVRKKGIRASSCTDSSTPTVDLSEDDSATATDDTPVAQSFVKSKRRTTTAARNYKDLATGSNQQASQNRPNEKLLKSIKQEKMN